MYFSHKKNLAVNIKTWDNFKGEKSSPLINAEQIVWMNEWFND